MTLAIRTNVRSFLETAQVLRRIKHWVDNHHDIINVTGATNAENIGGGEANIFAQKDPSDGTVLQFNTVSAGTALAVATSSNVVTFSFDMSDDQLAVDATPIATDYVPIFDGVSTTEMATLASILVGTNFKGFTDDAVVKGSFSNGLESSGVTIADSTNDMTIPGDLTVQGYDVTIGAGGATDSTLTFDGSANDLAMNWDESAGSMALAFNGTNRYQMSARRWNVYGDGTNPAELRFGDSALAINSQIVFEGLNNSGTLFYDQTNDIMYVTGVTFGVSSETSDPSATRSGLIYYYSTDGELRVRTGGGWRTVIDADISAGLSDNDILQWNLTDWVPRSLSEAGIAPDNASYVTMSDDASLSADRVLTAGLGLALTDGGANGNATLALDLDELTAETIVGDDEIPFNDVTDSGEHFTTFTNLQAAMAIGNIGDVVITAVADNEVLAYDSGGNWINQTAAEAGLATDSHTHALDDLSDVVITAVANNEVLAYDSGGNWINQTAAEAGLVPEGRKATIQGTANEIADPPEGTAQTLAADRTWTIGLADDAVMPGNASFRMPQGTTAQEPVAAEGLMRYDTTTSKFRICDGSTPAWSDLGGGGITELYTTNAEQVLTAGSTITATDGQPYTPISAGSAITLTSEPHIAAGREGQLVHLVNIGSFNITLQDVNALGSSLMRFTADTLTIQPAGTLTLAYDSNVGFWLEKYLLNPQDFTPAISSFTSDLQTTREIAAASTLDSKPQFTIAYIGTPSACSIDVDGGDPATDWPITVPSPYTALDNGTTPPTDDFYRQTTHNSTRIMTATATVSGTGGLTDTITFTYYNRQYCGPNTQSTALSSAQILALDGATGASILSNSAIYTYPNIDTTTGEYVWIAHRDAFTQPTHFTIENTGGTGGTNGDEPAAFTDMGTLSHTNDLGAVETFRMFRSNNTNFGTNKDVKTRSSEPNNRIYVGPHADTDPIPTASILEIDDTADGNSKISSSVAGSYPVTISTGEYLWVCHPDRVSDIATIKDQTTGFGIAGAYQTNVTHTNDNGYQETYRCWRSDNTGIYPSGETAVIT